MPYLRSILGITLLALIVALTACDSTDSSEDDPDGVNRWEGAYTAQARFGGANGRWGNGGTNRLIVSSSGQVTIDGALILNPSYDPSISRFEWNRANDNPTSGGITFFERSSDPDFADIGNGTVGQSFSGFIQNPGDGPLDYRGLLAQ